MKTPSTMNKFITNPIYLIALAGFFSTTNSARILGMFPLGAKSHFSCYIAVLKSLHNAGHQITMITPFPEEQRLANFTYIKPPTAAIFIGQNSISDFMDMTTLEIMNFSSTIEAGLCHDVMKLAEIKQVLGSSEKIYDVMMVEILTMHGCYQMVADRLRIPIIGMVTLHSWKAADNMLGISNNPMVPGIFGLSATGKGLNFFKSVRNLWLRIIFEYHYLMIVRKEIERFRYEYFAGQPSVREKEFSIVFYNNHPTFVPRQMSPNAIEIGGIHVQPASALPKDLLTFIDEAPNGVTLFSFGSIVRASTMTSEQRQAFITAFASIPQRVIWKFEEQINNLPNNIMLSNWVPQRDILEHKNVIAFISHCGQSGTYEAIITGTPIIAIPLFGDQSVNAGHLVRLGVAVDLEFKKLTKKNILDALNTIINDTNYYERMQTLSRVFADRPMTPQESVVYWTEYVIRNNGAPHLRALGADMPMYKYFMLDIIALALLVVFLTVLVIWTMIRKMYDVIVRKTVRVAAAKKKFE